MPRSQHPVTVPQGTWVELTAYDVTNITFQILEGAVAIRRGTSSQPTGDARGWTYSQDTGERDLPLSAISSATGARVWAFGLRFTTSTVLVDHA